MIIVASAVVAIVLLFGFVVWFGPPYLPIMRRQSDAVFELLDLPKGATILELGSGDGRFALAAARRGYRVVGIELNPLLVLWSRLVTWRYRKHVSIRWGDLWRRRWPAQVDGIYVFLLDKYMPRLDRSITEHYVGQGLRLASYTFQIPDKSPAREKEGVYLYLYNEK